MAIIVVVTVLSQMDFNVGNLGAILLMPIIASVLLGGTSSGGLSVLIALGFYIAHYTIGPGRQINPIDLERVMTTTFIMPATVILVGSLRRRLDAATTRERALRIEAAAERDRAEGILESITDAFFAVDHQWRYVYVNQQAEQLVGRTRSALLGHSVWQMFPPLVGSEFERQFRQAVGNGRSVHFEAYYPPFDAWFATHAYPSADGLSIYLHDITETKRAEASLAVRLEQQASVAALAQQALEHGNLDVLMDQAAEVVAATLHVPLVKILLLAQDGRLRLASGVGWNAGTVDSNVYDLATARAAGDALPGQEPRVVEDFAEDGGLALPPPLVEHRVVSGMSVPIGQVDVPFGVLGVHTTTHRKFTSDDVVYLRAVSGILASAMQRRQAGEQLARSEAQFRIMAQNLPAVLLLLDPSAGEVLYVSPGYEELWGRCCDELYRDPGAWLRGLHPDDRQRIETANRSFFERGTFDEVFRVQTPEGDLRWVHERILPIAGEEERPKRAVGIVRDITADRLAQERAAQLAAAQAGNRARDEVLAIVSHDLRSPLNTISLSAELIEAAPDAAARNKALAILRSALIQMNGLIGDLLDVAKLEAGGVLKVEKISLDVGSLLDDVREASLARVEQSQIRFETSMGPGARRLFGDRGRLRQVISNLLDNAFKFTPRGGSIAVRAEQHGENFQFSVRDSGCGIGPDQMAHLFERFWQADRDDERGVGLGLAICKGIVEAHGGRIWVESTPGKGTTVRFDIPAGEAGREAPRLSESPPPPWLRRP